MYRDSSRPRLRHYHYLTRSTHFPPAKRCPPGGIPAHTSSLSPFPADVPPQRIILPSGRHIYPAQHNEAHRCLYQTPLLPYLSCPRHTCRISSAVPLPPPKYILTSHSAASKPPFAATTAPGASLFPHSLSLVENIQYWPQCQPLCHICLTVVNVRPQCLSDRFLDHLHR